jgi:hypothetical protein
LRITPFIPCAECHYAERRYAECCYAESRYAESRYAESRYAESRYAECGHTGACNIKLFTVVMNAASYKLECLPLQLTYTLV